MAELSRGTLLSMDTILMGLAGASVAAGFVYLAAGLGETVHWVVNRLR